MFARVLYIDEEKALELNWFGLGALQVRFMNGAVRRAHPVQKRLFIDLVSRFQALGQPVHPSNPNCSALMKEFCDLLLDSPASLAWQLMFQSDLDAVARNFIANK